MTRQFPDIFAEMPLFPLLAVAAGFTCVLRRLSLLMVFNHHLNKNLVATTTDCLG